MNTEWERFSFSSPAIPKAHTGKGLSRPRMAKLRRQSSKPPPMEPPLQQQIVEDFDNLTIQGTRSGIHHLQEGLSNLGINAPFDFVTALNDDLNNLSIEKPLDTKNDAVSESDGRRNDLFADANLNEEMKKMDIKETVDSSEGIERTNSEAFNDDESVLSDGMRSLSMGAIDETVFEDKLKLSDEEDRFVFTGSKVDKSQLDETGTSKSTRPKHKKKGTKQKVHLWSGTGVASSDTKSDDSFSPMDISPSSDSQPTEPVTAPTPAFTFGVQRRKPQANVETGAEECERWRMKGNLAYKAGDWAAAEEFYKKGICSVPREEEVSRSSLRALVLCYSNLAATHMSLGRLVEALHDCKEAAFIDPTFYKVHLRAATCHLLMGRVEEATGNFRKCLSGSDASVDRKIAVEASDGLQKVEKFIKLSSEAGDNSDREAALEAASNALLISPCCERMLEIKAGLLFTMRRYEAVVAFTQSSLVSAEKNSLPDDSSHRDWRFRLAFLSYFHLGKLEDALTLNESGEYGTIDGPISSLVSTVQKLLRYKAAGNEAMQAGKPLEAIEHYTSAISLTTESRPFAAICFFNRSAAHKSLGNVIDAIADCNLAIALDGNYVKALSRRATLYEMIRDYDEAASDLRRVLSWSSDGSRLLWMEEEARKDVPLDLYTILGVSRSASNAEIKKAYRKAALRHHPDKAGQVLARSDESVWREIGEEVRENAEKLFKRIGEAYAVLCDSLKRSQYDEDEDIRKNGVRRSYA